MYESDNEQFKSNNLNRQKTEIRSANENLDKITLRVCSINYGVTNRQLQTSLLKTQFSMQIKRSVLRRQSVYCQYE